MYYSVIFIIFVLIIFTGILSRISYINYEKRIYGSWTTILITYIYSFALNFGTIPLLGTFTSIFNCNNNTLRLNPNVICWNTLHYVLCGCSIFFTFLTVFHQLYFGYLYIETTGIGKRINISSVTNIFFIEEIVKISVTILFIFSNDSELIHWIIEIILLNFYGYIFYRSMNENGIYKVKFMNIVLFHIIIGMVHLYWINFMGTYIVFYIHNI